MMIKFKSIYFMFIFFSQIEQILQIAYQRKIPKLFGIDFKNFCTKFYFLLSA